MIILGIGLLLAALLQVAILWPIGIILLFIGLFFWVLGATGRAIGGGRHYY